MDPAFFLNTAEELTKINDDELEVELQREQLKADELEIQSKGGEDPGHTDVKRGKLG